MTKKTFKRTRIEDLTGGVNTNDYSSEIEDKQGTVVENFNFEGNKLVSGPSYDRVYNAVGDDSIVRGLTVDVDDIWYVKSGNLYKNGSIEKYANEYILSFTGDVNGELFSISIDGVGKVIDLDEFGTEEEAKEQLLLDLQSFFPSYLISRDGESFIIKTPLGEEISFTNPNLVKSLTLEPWDVNSKIDITIDGTTFNLLGTTYGGADSALNSIGDSLSSSTYHKRGSSGNKLTIARKDLSAISFSFIAYDRYTATIGYTTRDTPNSSQTPIDTTTTIDGIDYVFDGHGTRLFSGDEIIRDLGGYQKFSNTFSYSSSGPNGWKGTTIKPIKNIKLNNAIFRLAGGDVRVVDGGNGSVIFTGTADGSGGIFFNNLELSVGGTYFIEQYREDGEITYLYPASQFTNKSILALSASQNGVDSGGDRIYGLRNLSIIGEIIDKSVYTYTTSFTLNSGTEEYWDESNFSQYFNKTHYLSIRKNDYSDINVSSNTRFDSASFPDEPFGFSYSKTNSRALSSLVNYNEIEKDFINDGTQFEEWDLYNMVVSNYGTLLTSLRRNSYFIDKDDNTVTELSIGSVGRPSVGTVYNGKIVLGGYEGNDNIVYSQTDDLISEENKLLLFNGYSSGAQSVSGGNKGVVTGFVVGENGLYVFKDEEIWYTNTEDDTGTSFKFIFNKLTSNGVYSQSAIAEVGQEIIYLDYKNRKLRRLGYERDSTTLRDTSISDDIDQLLKAIPDDDEGNDDRFSTLISLNYKEPYLEICYPTIDSPYIYVNGADENFRYRAPDNRIIYNTDNKSFTTRKEIGRRPSVRSFKGIVGNDVGEIEKNFVGNTEQGTYFSKRYVAGDDNRVDKYCRFDIVGKLIPDEGETKTLTVNIYVGEKIVKTKTFTATQELRIKDKLTFYRNGESIEFELLYEGEGRVEIYDVSWDSKPTTFREFI